MADWIYKQTEERLWTTGHETASGRFEPESDHGSPEEAAARVHYLHGGLTGAVTTGVVTDVLARHAGGTAAELVEAFAAALAVVDPGFDDARFRAAVPTEAGTRD